jgi:hypothetical protein
MNTERYACLKITQKMCGCHSKTKVGSRGSETKEGRNKVKKVKQFTMGVERRTNKCHSNLENLFNNATNSKSI